MLRCALSLEIPNFRVHVVSKDQDPIAADAQDADAQCVRSALRGDLAAFDGLVERHQRRATAVAYRLLNNRDDAMEVVQDAFMNAFDKLDTLSRPERFGPWLMRIVSNLALNRRRSRALRSAVSLEQIADSGDGRGELNRPDNRAESPDAAASAREVRRLIAQGIEELPDMQRQALVLFSIGKMPQKDVAEMLGCSVEAVKWHVFTARKKLKEQLKEFM